MGSRRKLLERLYAKSPRCYWCGKETFLPPLGQNSKNHPDMATFDHYPTQIINHVPGTPHVGVLACLKCNTSRCTPQVQIPLAQRQLESHLQNMRNNPQYKRRKRDTERRDIVAQLSFDLRAWS